jgi:hypothetical protein
MRPTKARTLVLTALICAVGMWLLLRQVYSSLPPLPWSGVPALALLAGAETITGRNVRARLAGRGTPIPPIAVARIAVLAKASSLAAALIGGLAAAVLLIAAALYLEHGCRVPPGQDQGAEPGQPPSGAAR